MQIYKFKTKGELVTYDVDFPSTPYFNSISDPDFTSEINDWISENQERLLKELQEDVKDYCKVESINIEIKDDSVITTVTVDRALNDAELEKLSDGIFYIYDYTSPRDTEDIIDDLHEEDNRIIYKHYDWVEANPDAKACYTIVVVTYLILMKDYEIEFLNDEGGK